MQKNSLAANTIFLYVRIILMVLISFYTSRVVLDVLGAEDFGIYGLVYSIVALLSFFNTTLSNSIQRFLSVSLGNSDINVAQKIVSQSFVSVIVVSILILILGSIFGEYVLSRYLNIPEKRLGAAITIYYIGLFSILITFVQIVFSAILIARENMKFYAYIGLLDIVLKLLLVWGIQVIPRDHLVVYGVFMALSSCIVLIIQAVYCFKKYPEAKLLFLWDSKLFGDMMRFIGVNFYGTLAVAGFNQGIDIILNLYFGPILNASKGIATQIKGAVTRFSDGIISVTSPRVIRSYAQGDRSYMLSLMMRSSKFSFFVLFALSLPLLFQTEYVVSVWLKSVPEYTILFARLILVGSLFDSLFPPLWNIAVATGKIRNIQIYGRSFSLLSLGIIALLMKFYPFPWLPLTMAIVTNIAYWLYNLVDIHRQVGLEYRVYIRFVLIPIFSVVVPSLVIAYILTTYSAFEGLGQVLFSFILMEIFCFVFIWLGGSTLEERERVKRFFRNKINGRSDN